MITATCKACGDLLIRSGRYCPPCNDNVREMVDEHNSAAEDRAERKADLRRTIRVEREARRA